MNPIPATHADKLAQICRKHGVRQLELFGSAAGSGFDPERSDLDFLISFEDLPPPRFADAYFDVLEELEQLFRRKVDLVVEDAINNPYFLEGIKPSRVLVYAA